MRYAIHICISQDGGRPRPGVVIGGCTTDACACAGTLVEAVAVATVYGSTSSSSSGGSR